MTSGKYILITFKETADALYMERVCRKDGMEGRIIPLPKSIDAGCGLSWASGDRDSGRWEKYMEERKIVYDRITEVEL